MDDIFNDISDSDVVESIDTVYVNDRPHTTIEYFESVSKRYNKTLIIVFNRLYSIYTTDKCVNEALSRMLRKIYNLFDLYGVEYSETYLQQNFRTNELVDCKIGPVTVLSERNYAGYQNIMNMVICFKCPEFSYMTALRFMIRLYDIIFRKCIYDFVQNIDMYDTVCSESHQYYNKHAFTFNKYYDTVNMNTFDTLSYVDWRFFYRVINIFFGLSVTLEMSKRIENGRHPFTGKPLTFKIEMTHE